MIFRILTLSLLILWGTWVFNSTQEDMPELDIEGFKHEFPGCECDCEEKQKDNKVRVKVY